MNTPEYKTIHIEQKLETTHIIELLRGTKLQLGQVQDGLEVLVTLIPENYKTNKDLNELNILVQHITEPTLRLRALELIKNIK